MANNHGGYRPNSGGAREGAGRKSKGSYYQPMTQEIQADPTAPAQMSLLTGLPSDRWPGQDTDKYTLSPAAIEQRQMALEVARAKRRAMSEANKESLQFDYAISKLPPVSKRVPEEIQERTDLYFNLCVQYGQKPTIAGYALSLGVTRSTLDGWCRGRGVPPETQQICVKGWGLINTQYEHHLQDGSMNPIGAIFVMRNSFGYTNEDTRDEGITGEKEAARSANEVAEKYRDLLDTED